MKRWGIQDASVSISEKQGRFRLTYYREPIGSPIRGCSFLVPIFCVNDVKAAIEKIAADEQYVGMSLFQRVANQFGSLIEQE